MNHFYRIWKEAEEKLTSIPLIGSAVQRAQKRSLESFNTASIKGIIDEAYQEARRLLTTNREKLEKMNFFQKVFGTRCNT